MSFRPKASAFTTHFMLQHARDTGNMSPLCAEVQVCNKASSRTCPGCCCGVPPWPLLALLRGGRRRLMPDAHAAAAAGR